MTVSDILGEIRRSYQDILGGSLVGIYVHGSIAFGCFNWASSDIDFLAVVRRAPSLREKTALIASLLALDAHAPPKGFEMSVVLESACRRFVHPAPFELHFSNAHKARCLADLEGFCREMHGTDRDLAAHFTVIRAAGIALCGEPIDSLFGVVPRADYVDSIRFDVAGAADEIEANPVYVILNLCRVLAYLRDGAILSKDQGGAWGLSHLPAEYRGLVAGARGRYAANLPFAPDAGQARRFAQYMLEQISME